MISGGDDLATRASPALRRAFGLGCRVQGLRFMASTRNARSIARRTLKNILESNADAEFTRARMGGFTSLDRFRSLPTTTYDDYLPYVDRLANGRGNGLTVDPVTSFLLSSGTTGKPKLLPVTKRQSDAIRWHMMAPLGLALGEGTLGPIRAPWFHPLTLYPGRVSAGGIPIASAPAEAITRMRWVFERLWCAPLPVFRVLDQASARYLHVLSALLERDLWCILSFYPSILLNAFRDMHARADELLRDIADGTLSRQLELSAEQRVELARYRQPNPERAREMERLRSAGNWTASAIWPGMRTVVTAGSGVYGFYVNQLKPHLGDVRVFSPVYAASEGVVGIRVSARHDGYTVSPTAAYVEFIPAGASARGDASPRSMDEIEAGGIYEIVITNYAGFVRYRLGDLVEVVGWQGEAPIVRFLERRGQLLDVSGEKVTEAQIARVFEAACEERGARVVDYVVTIDLESNPARYALLVEWAAGAAGDVDALLRAFDRRLRELNAIYEKWRQVGMLSPPAAIELEPGSFERFRELRIAQGTTAGQVKIPHVVSDPEFARRHFASVRRVALSA
jgi:hypothetical protein